MSAITKVRHGVSAKFSYKTIIVALGGFLALFQYFDKQVELQPGLGPDEIYLYTLGLHTIDSDLIAGLLDRIGEFQEASYALPAEIEAFALRAGFADNYFLPSHLMGIAFRAVDRLVSAPALSYPELFALKLNAGIAVWYLLAVVLLVAVLVAATDRAAAACGAALLAVFVMNALAPVVVQYRIESWSDPAQAFQQIALLFVSDKSIFTIFGHTPRAYMYLLLFGVAALRLSGRYRLAYWVLFALTLVHFIYALLALILILAIDVLVRPGTVLKFDVKLPILAAVTSSLLFGGSLVHLVGRNPTPAIIAVLGFALFFWPRASVMLVRFHTARIAPWLPRREGLLDILLMLGAAGLAFGVSALGTEFADFRSSKYFYQELPGRLIGILRPLLIVYFCYVVLDMMRERSIALERITLGYMVPLSLALLCVARLYVTHSAPYSVWDVPGAVDDAETRTVAFQDGDRPARRPDLLYQSVLIYYAVNKQAETGSEVLEPVLEAIYGTPAPSGRHE